MNGIIIWLYKLMLIYCIIKIKVSIGVHQIKVLINSLWFYTNWIDSLKVWGYLQTHPLTLFYIHSMHTNWCFHKFQPWVAISAPEEWKNQQHLHSGSHMKKQTILIPHLKVYIKTYTIENMVHLYHIWIKKSSEALNEQNDSIQCSLVSIL